MATIVTAGYAGSQYYLNKQTQAAIVVPSLEIASVAETPGVKRYWTIAPHISNQGNQTSGNVLSVMGVMYRVNSLPFNDTFTNPDTAEITIDENANITSLRAGPPGRPPIMTPRNFVSIGGIGPRQDVQLGILSIPETEAALLKSGQETLFLVGRINYQDTFERSIWHVAKYCYRIYGNAADTENFAKWGERRVDVYDPSDWRLTYRMCAFNNCSDEQCASQQ